MPGWLQIVATALFSVMLGSAGTYFLEVEREKRAETRERLARREAFLRDALAELQEDLLEWEKWIRILHLRKMEHSQLTVDTRWLPGMPFADADSEKLLTAQRRVEILSARSIDAEIMNLVNQAKNEIDKAISAQSADEAWNHVKESAKLQKAASDRAGRELLKYV